MAEFETGFYDPDTGEVDTEGYDPRARVGEVRVRTFPSGRIQDQEYGRLKDGSYGWYNVGQPYYPRQDKQAARQGKQAADRDPFRETPEERELDRQYRYWKDQETLARNDRDFAAEQEAKAKAEDIANRKIALDEKRLGLQEGELTGLYNGQPTLALRQLDETKLNNAHRRLLETAGVTGRLGGENTLARDEFEANDAYRKALLALKRGDQEEAKRQFDIAEGFKQRIDTARLQFDIERDPVSFVHKLYALSGQTPPGGELDLAASLRPFGGPQDRVPSVEGPPGERQGQPPGQQQARPWWENYSLERLERFPDEELATLPPEVLSQFRNEFFLERPALLALLPPERVRGEGRWQGTGFANEIIAKFGKGAPVPKVAAPTAAVRQPGPVNDIPPPTQSMPDFRTQPVVTEPNYANQGLPNIREPIAPPAAPPLAELQTPLVDRPDLEIPPVAEPTGQLPPATSTDPRFTPGRLPALRNF